MPKPTIAKLAPPTPSTWQGDTPLTMPPKTQQRVAALLNEMQITINTAAEIMNVPPGWQYEPAAMAFLPPGWRWDARLGTLVPPPEATPEKPQNEAQ